MKLQRLFILTSLLLGACTRAASTPAPTLLPVNFPTLMPAQIAECQPADLQSSSNTNGATGVIVLGITLTNQSKNICKLSNPAAVSLLTSNREPIQVQMIDNNSEVLQTLPAPSTLILAPTDNKILTVIWRNFCQKLPDDKLILSIHLTEKQDLDIPMKIQALPRCEAETEASTISVMPYSDPP
jgi:hypothetical protein